MSGCMLDPVASPRTVHPQVTRFLARSERAKLVVDQLVARGFEVIALNLTGKLPVIWVANRPQCSELDSVAVAHTPSCRGKLTVYAAPFNGCQVQWQVVGN